MRTKNKYIKLSLSFVLSLLFITSVIIPAKIYASVNAVNLKISYINVGQADCILLQSNGSNMLIDAGNNDDEKTVIDYLNKQGIKKIDYLIGTHPHEDHIGSMDAVIKNYEIGKIIMPKVTTTTKTFQDVMDAVRDKGLKITAPNPGDTFNFGSTQVTELAPNSDSYEDLNNYSIVLKVKNGDNTFLFMGDAEDISEKEILSKGFDVKADVLKVGHHGSSSSTTQAFLDKVNPKYAIISVGKDNDYGHPNKGTLDRLTAKGVTTYRTDIKGTIVCESDGKTVTFPGLTTPTAAATSTKISASVNNSSPKKNATVKLTVNGPKSAQVVAVCHYKSKNTTYKGTISSNGSVTIPIKIGSAASKYKVNIDITVTYSGKSYKTKTYFTPR